MSAFINVSSQFYVVVIYRSINTRNNFKKDYSKASVGNDLETSGNVQGVLLIWSNDTCFQND